MTVRVCGDDGISRGASSKGSGGMTVWERRQTWWFSRHAHLGAL